MNYLLARASSHVWQRLTLWILPAVRTLQPKTLWRLPSVELMPPPRSGLNAAQTAQIIAIRPSMSR